MPGVGKNWFCTDCARWCGVGEPCSAAIQPGGAPGATGCGAGLATWAMGGKAVGPAGGATARCCCGCCCLCDCPKGPALPASKASEAEPTVANSGVAASAARGCALPAPGTVMLATNRAMLSR